MQLKKLKNTILLLAFSTISVANVYAAKGHGSSDVGEALALPDVSNENGMYFFCKGENVIIQNCEGKIVKPGIGCEGPSREVKRKDFFNELRGQIKIENLAGLNPLFKEDIELYNTPEGQPAEVRQMANFDKTRALARIKEVEQEILNLAPSEQAKKMPELKALHQALEASEKLITKANATEQEMKLAIKKVNDALDKVIDVNICDSSVTFNLNKDSNSFLSTVLKQYDPKAVARKETLADGKLELVKREVGEDGKNRDYWKDTTTGLTWGPVDDGKKVKELQEKLKLTTKYRGKEYPDYEAAAVEYCKTLGMELPSQKDFLDALKNPESEKREEPKKLFGRNVALKDSLPDMKNRVFWSSSSFPWYDYRLPLYFNGDNGEIEAVRRFVVDYSIRCVSRSK